MGIRDWFKKGGWYQSAPTYDPPAPANTETDPPDPISHYAEESFNPDTMWVIEIFDPEYMPFYDLSDILTEDAPTLLGPFDDSLFALALLEKTLEHLNEDAEPDDIFSGRIRRLMG